MSVENDFFVDGVDITLLPKISLHDHLDGSLRPETILELAAEAGIAVPATDPEALMRWFSEASNSGSLVEYLKTFDLTCAVMQTAENLTRVARESVIDLAVDGVIYGELRWAPEQHLTQGLTLDEAVEAVQVGIEEGIDEAEELGYSIRIGQLVTAMRHAHRSLEIAELAVRHRKNGVVGFDIAGAELGFPASNHVEAFNYLAHEYFPVTIHAGEADGLGSIESALFDGRALRLGHGVRLAEDIEVDGKDGDATYVTMGMLAHWVKDRGITLETSPTSNLQTGAIAQWGDDITDHPFDLLYQLGFIVTVNTDNRLQSDTTLSRELWLVADAFSYDLADLETFQQNAAASAFLPSEERDALADLISEGFVAAVAESRRN
jgi:adenosine deaminase